MNYFCYLTSVTACCTVCVNGDRGVAQAAAVRCMVVVTMGLTGFIGMTGGTGYRSTVFNYSRYCAGRRIVMLTVTTVICMTGITVTDLVVMQRDNLAPGADRGMTGGTTGAVRNLVSNAVVISYVMTKVLTRMDRMTVKVSCMTVRAGTLDNRGCVSAR